MPFGIGIWEIVILMVVLLLVFGAKRLPEMGRSIGPGCVSSRTRSRATKTREPEKTELTPPPAPESAAPPAAPPSEPERVETERVSS